MSLLAQISSNLQSNATAVRVAATAVAGYAALVVANRVLDSVVAGNPVLAAQDKNWTNWGSEIILITGGSSGMGRLMVERFAARKITVVVFDIFPAKEALPSGVAFYQVDITDDKAVHEAAERVRADVGSPTVLINNAGIGHGQTLLDASVEQMRRVFAVNAIAPIIMLKEFLPAMAAKDHGHVVTMASMASFGVICNNVDYSCTKSAVQALHEGLRQELKHRYNAPNVKTTIVHPFWVDTPLLQDLVSSGQFNDPVLKPETVADAVVKQVIRGCSGQIILPKRLAVATLTQGFPLWLQEKIRDQRAVTLMDPRKEKK